MLGYGCFPGTGGSGNDYGMPLIDVVNGFLLKTVVNHSISVLSVCLCKGSDPFRLYYNLKQLIYLIKKLK